MLPPRTSAGCSRLLRRSMPTLRPEVTARRLRRPPHDQARSCGRRMVRGFARSNICFGRSSRSRVSGALNRLCVHPSVVHFAERAFETSDLLVYQTRISGQVHGRQRTTSNRCRTDRNHSWLPARGAVAVVGDPQAFIYFSDVTDDHAPTHGAPRRFARPIDHGLGRHAEQSAELYAAEHSASGVQGSMLVFCLTRVPSPDVGPPPFRRSGMVPDGRELQGCRSGTGSASAHAQSQATLTALGRVRVAACVEPRELQVKAFAALVKSRSAKDAATAGRTALRYPNLDLTPWRSAHSEE